MLHAGLTTFFAINWSSSYDYGVYRDKYESAKIVAWPTGMSDHSRANQSAGLTFLLPTATDYNTAPSQCPAQVATVHAELIGHQLQPQTGLVETTSCFKLPVNKSAPGRSPTRDTLTSEMRHDGVATDTEILGQLIDLGTFNSRRDESLH
jgi:hypothetical protein